MKSVKDFTLFQAAGLAMALLTTAQVRSALKLANRSAQGVDNDTLEIYINAADASILQARGAHPEADTQVPKEQEELNARKGALIELVNYDINGEYDKRATVIDRRLQQQDGYGGLS